jgi:hypothetical protein
MLFSFRKKLRDTISCLEKYRLGAWLNFVFMRLAGREMVKTGKCICCGACCRNINLKIDGSWLKSEDEFKKYTQSLPEYSRFVITGTDKQGYLKFRCSCQKDDMSCGDYEKRPDICRAFPEKSLVFCGGQVPDTCGFTIKPGVPFSKRLEQAQKKNGP